MAGWPKVKDLGPVVCSLSVSLPWVRRKKHGMQFAAAQGGRRSTGLLPSCLSVRQKIRLGTIVIPYVIG